MNLFNSDFYIFKKFDWLTKTDKEVKCDVVYRQLERS